MAKSDIMKNIEEWAEFKQQKDLKKTDGSKNKKVLVEKHSEAHEWGKKESDQCTLILTEGDSAKALAVSFFDNMSSKRESCFTLKSYMSCADCWTHNHWEKTLWCVPSPRKVAQREGSEPQSDNAEC